MNDLLESINAYAAAHGLAMPFWDSEIPEGEERRFPHVVLNLAGGKIDRMFRQSSGDALSPKLEGYRLQMDLYRYWDGNSAPAKTDMQNIIDTLEEAVIPMVNPVTLGTRQFVSLWRDGLIRESVEDKVIRLSQDWEYTLLRGP